MSPETRAPHGDDPREMLLHFGALILLEHETTGEIDDRQIQALAMACGLIVPVTAPEPCGAGCVCTVFPAKCFTIPAAARAIADDIARDYPTSYHSGVVPAERSALRSSGPGAPP